MLLHRLVALSVLIATAGAAQRTAAQSRVVATTLPQVDTTVVVRANGIEIAFDPALITLRQGTRVRIRFINVGLFAHNFVLVRNEDDIELLSAKAQDAPEHVPLMLKSKMLAYSNLAEPTKSVETSFVVPPVGTYTYVCLVEGHANVMVGKLRSLP